jgi:hypothetical protein
MHWNVCLLVRELCWQSVVLRWTDASLLMTAGGDVCDGLCCRGMHLYRMVVCTSSVAGGHR